MCNEPGSGIIATSGYRDSTTNKISGITEEVLLNFH